MNIRKITPQRIAVTLAAVALAAGVAACSASGGTNGQQQENQQQSNDTTTYEQVQPIPHFTYSQYRATLTEVEAIQALGSQTTSFFFNQGVADPIFSCPSLGMPVPATAQLSNPQQIENDGYPQGGAAVTIGQMDPNGIYAPPDSTGTNVLCLNSAGQPYIQYWEGFVDAVSGAARWDMTTHQVVVVGQPTVPNCKVTMTTKANGQKSSATTCTK